MKSVIENVVTAKSFRLMALSIVGVLSLMTLPPFGYKGQYVMAQEKVRSLTAEIYPESGCPVEVTLAKTDLDLDPFDAPIDARIYITYKNASSRPVSAVKFRIRFTNETGRDLGTFQAPDGFMLGPGMERTQKWKQERVDSRMNALKVRVLMVRFADDSLWESVKVRQQPGPPQQEPNQEPGDPPQQSP